MPDDEPLQVDEVVLALSRDKGCSIAHIGSGRDVSVWFDGRDGQKNPWQIRAMLREIPEKSSLREALAMGFVLSSNEFRVYHGPESGAKYTLYELNRGCFGIRAAAIKAVQLARAFDDVGADEWLWVTTTSYEDRDHPPPKPPAGWPPRRA